jgi:cysteine desulfurase
MVAIKGEVAISNGSACTSQSYSPSHVLEAMGLGKERIRGALRISWCHLTEDPDWESVVAAIARLQ